MVGNLLLSCELHSKQPDVFWLLALTHVLLATGQFDDKSLANSKGLEAKS